MSWLLTLATYRKRIQSWSKTDLSHNRRDLRPIRWFLLLWVGLAFLWGGAQMLLGETLQMPIGDLFIFIKLTPPAPSAQFTETTQLHDHFFIFGQTTPPFKLIFVALLLAQFGLHWLCLSGKVQRWYWSYFPLQCLCICAMSLIWSDSIIMLGLFLVLVIEALNALKQVRQLVVVVASALILFIAILTWQLTQVALKMTFESILLLVIFLIGWVILSIQQVYARGQLEAAHLQLAAYAIRVEELTLLNERQRLARELHDTLAQDLVGLTLQLERVDLHLEKARVERARELVQQAMARARATLAEARRAIDDLRAHTPGPQDLLLAVQREIKRFRVTTSIPCVAELSALALVPDHLCEHVLRAITEGLTNVARHAQAQQVWIYARLNEAQLVIEVRDDGIGFESSAVVAQQGHYGLLGVRERARLCGGHLDIESSAAKGTVLRLHLPITQKGALE